MTMRLSRFFWAFIIILGALLVISALHLHPLTHTPAFWIMWCAAALFFLTVILAVAVGDDDPNDQGPKP